MCKDNYIHNYSVRIFRTMSEFESEIKTKQKTECVGVGIETECPLSYMLSNYGVVPNSNVFMKSEVYESLIDINEKDNGGILDFMVWLETLQTENTLTSFHTMVKRKGSTGENIGLIETFLYLVHEDFVCLQDMIDTEQFGILNDDELGLKRINFILRNKKMMTQNIVMFVEQQNIKR